MDLHMWFFEKFGTPQTLIGSLLIISVFLRSYVIVGYRATKEVYRNELVIRILERELSQKHPSDRSAAVLTLLTFRERLLGDGRVVVVEKMWKRLTRYFEQSKVVKNSHLFRPEPYCEALRNDIISMIIPLHRSSATLFRLGLLGTVVGVILALATQQIPTNPEESKTFSMVMLQGLGLAYTTTFFGMAGSLLPYLLATWLEDVASDLVGRFEVLLYDTVTPVIQATEYVQDTRSMQESVEV